MQGPVHVSIAILTTGVALYAVNHGQVDMSAPAIAAMSVAAIGALVPDIDHPRAWISNRIPGTLLLFGVMVLGSFWASQWSLAGNTTPTMSSALLGPVLQLTKPLLGWAWLAVALGVALLVTSMLVASMAEHRGPTHSLTVGAGLSLIACVGFAIAGQPLALGLWFGWGYLSHLLADLLTPMGCPALLWPLGEGACAAWPSTRPASMPMTRPGVQEIGTPSQITSADANGDSGLTQPVEDLQSHMTTGFAQDVLAPSDSEAD